ncbi:MAG TPA: hypothetical protein VMR97_08410 [Acidimicrobiales bacterium]|nr:hypothetical protein [Acidimicrobiales bacterium]
MKDQGTDDVLDALDEVTQAMDETYAWLAAVRTRASVIQDKRASGVSYTDIVRDAPEPLLVQMLTSHLLEMQRVGHRFRRAEVLALRAEGLSTVRIAEFLHISHERVSVLARLAEGKSLPS